MTDPITGLVIAKVVDAAFTALSVGLEREVVLGKVAELERAGATPDEIADALADMRRASSAAARLK
jgi:hypothetical protein